MKIRSITCFFNPATPHAPQILRRMGELASEAEQRFQEAGCEVQSHRLATVPFPLILDNLAIDSAVEYALEMQAKARMNGFAYVSLGPALAGFPESYSLVAPMLAATEAVFLGGEIAVAGKGVVLSGVNACGKVIAEASTISSDGFANLRFAALANVRPYAPFFPAAYAVDDQPAFALAIESADIALEIFRGARSLSAARKRLLQTLETQGLILEEIAGGLSRDFEVAFKGIDFSLAPFPKKWCSLGAALEQLGPVSLGLAGSLAAAAFLADTLDRGNWHKVGFNGLMLPVLEDSTLAARSAGGTLTLKDLLLYSAVCGTGLDTVPLPGDAVADQLAAVLLDVAALSTRLGKPLTARLMPIPGKKAGDEIHFDFDYFADGRVMDLPSKALHGPLSGSEDFTLYSRY